ncbi:MAG: hypothetical protein WBN65_00035 [Gammaproteobacteria bacterium]
MMKSFAAVVVLALGLGGCAMPTSQATKDQQLAPEFTEAEKAEMTTEEKTAIYNAAMSKKGDELVCRREKRVGSHMSTTVCFTRAEIEANRKSAQEAMFDAKGASLKPGQ